MMVGLVGLGRMGQAIAARLLKAGIDVIGYDTYPAKELDISVNGESRACGKFTQVATLEQLAQKVSFVWLMVPAGKPVDDVLQEIIPHLKKKSIIIDGGNSFFKDSVRRFTLLREQELDFLDCGTSGGLHGRTIGFCLMVGGLPDTYTSCEFLLKAIAAPQGYAHVGPAGAGHYVKMVHNGIEYALLQAYAEGFHVLKEGHYKELDLAQIADLWNHGSIIRSWILELARGVLAQDQTFAEVFGAIQESGTGLWTVEEADEHAIPVTLIKQALQIRAESRQSGGNYATKLVALLRHAFGGHTVTYTKDTMTK